MEILEILPAEGEFYPEGLKRIDYASGVDGLRDRAFLLPGRRRDLWIVVLHGHGARGDQLFTRPDIRTNWLPEFTAAGASIICPGLRGNSWMSPAAAEDMRGLICFLRSEQGMRRAVFCSGSMGGTANLIYGVLHPGDVDGIIARGAAADIAGYYAWCLRRKAPALEGIASAIRTAYGGAPDEIPEVYNRHSARGNADKLNMPVALTHGEADDIIPVAQARGLACLLAGRNDFFYREIPGGGHDSPLLEKEGFRRVMRLAG